MIRKYLGMIIPFMSAARGFFDKGFGSTVTGSGSGKYSNKLQHKTRKQYRKDKWKRKISAASRRGIYLH